MTQHCQRELEHEHWLCRLVCQRLWAWATLGLCALMVAALGPAFGQTAINPAPVAIACAYNAVLPTLLSGTFGWVQCSPTGVPIFQSPLTSPITGQAIIVVTGTAVQLATNALVNGLVVKAKSTNNSTCGTVGGASITNDYTGSGNGYGLCPGEASSFAVGNSNLLYVNGTAGDIFTFEGN